MNKIPLLKSLRGFEKIKAVRLGECKLKKHLEFLFMDLGGHPTIIILINLN